MFRTKRILVADDDPQMIEMLSELLEYLGHSVVSCKNGEEALDNLTKSKFDLLVTDLNMPEMSGFGLIKNIRLRQPSLPILVVTGLDDIRYEKLFKQFSRVEFLLKPLRLIDVSEKVGKLFKDKG